jgi:hypothetical protein
MRRPLILASLILTTAVALSAQVSLPNAFAGSWKSAEKDPQTRRTMVISVSGNVLHVKEDFLSYKRPISNEATLFLDKTGEKNLLNVPGGDAPFEVHSVSSLKKDKLLRKAEYSVLLRDSTYNVITSVRITEEYSLSKDGNTLTLKSISTRAERTEPSRPATLPPGRVTPMESQLIVFPSERTYYRQQ